MSRQDKPELGNLDEDILSDIFKELDEAGLEDIGDLEEDFLNEDFLEEDFLKEFDLEEEEKKAETGEEDILSLFGDADSILNGVKEQMDSADTNNDSNAALEAFLGTGGESAKEESLPMGDFSIESLFAEDSNDGQEALPQDDADVLKILEGLEGIDLELEEDSTGVEQNGDMNNAALEAFMGQQTGAAEPAEERHEKKEKKGKKEKKKSGEKKGFLSKLELILFGEDDEEEEEKNKKTVIDFGDSTDIETIDIGGEDAENLMLFGESPAPTPKKEEEKNKKGKKEKKKKEKKEKKEKPKKEKKPRPKKEKKPKPPKEPDNSPPLPKKPVFLIFLMAASLVALIFMGSNLLGYSNQMNNAKNLYAKQNYSEAFAEISGMEIKEEDLELYEKYHIMAMVSTELEAYESLMTAGYYDMAIDCLIRTIGRAEKYRVEAGIYGCVAEMDSLAQEAEAVLGQMFGVSRERALELYASKTKEEYSYAIKRIIKELGLEKVSE